MGPNLESPNNNRGCCRYRLSDKGTFHLVHWKKNEEIGDEGNAIEVFKGGKERNIECENRKEQTRGT